MRCEICGRKIKDLYEEKCAFWDDLMDAEYIDDALDAPWVYGNVCWKCAHDSFMEVYYRENPDRLNRYYFDEEERREDPSDNYWPDD